MTSKYSQLTYWTGKQGFTGKEQKLKTEWAQTKEGKDDCICFGVVTCLSVLRLLKLLDCETCTKKTWLSLVSDNPIFKFKPILYYKW